MPVDKTTVSRLTRLRAPRGHPATPPALQQGQRAGPAPGGPPGSVGRSPLDHGPKVSPPRRRQRRWLPVFSPSYPEGRPVGLHGGRSRAGLTPGHAEPGTRRWETSGRRAHPGCGPQNAGVQGAAEERGGHACAQRGAPEAGEAVYVRVLGVSFLLPRGWACARSSQPQGPRSENPSKLRKPCVQTAGAGGPQGTWPGSGNKPAVPPPGTAAHGEETDRGFVWPETLSTERLRACPLTRPWGQPRAVPGRMRHQAPWEQLGLPFWGCGSPPRTGIPDRTNPELEQTPPTLASSHWLPARPAWLTIRGNRW